MHVDTRSKHTHFGDVPLYTAFLDSLKRDGSITAAHAIRTINQINQLFLRACFPAHCDVPSTTLSSEAAPSTAPIALTDPVVNASYPSSSASPVSSPSSQSSPSSISTASAMAHNRSSVYACAGLDRRVVLEEDTSHIDISLRA